MFRSLYNVEDLFTVVTYYIIDLHHHTYIKTSIIWHCQMKRFHVAAILLHDNVSQKLSWCEPKWQ